MLGHWFVTAHPIIIKIAMSGLFTDCGCLTCTRDREAGGTPHQAAAIRLVGLGTGQQQWCLYQWVRASMELDMLARERSMNPR